MAELSSAQASVGKDTVKAMFPKTSHHNINIYFTKVEKALDDQILKQGIKDADSITKLKLYAFATIRVENARFNPGPERTSKYNTLTARPKIDESVSLPGNTREILKVIDFSIDSYHLDRPFRLYDDDARGNHRLGNTREGMGLLYKGRGFIQITGLANYSRYAALANAPQIVADPDKASDPDIAARILAAYILDKKHCDKILQALQTADFRKARAVVNGTRALHYKELAESYEMGAKALIPSVIIQKRP